MIQDDGRVPIFASQWKQQWEHLRFRGRQLSCEHGNRRVVRYERDGKTTILADRFGGRFNAPNDVVVHPDGGIWFTDPGYGSLMNYEGNRADTGSVMPIQKEAVYY